MKHVVKAKKAYLKSPLTASATSVVLRSLVDTKGNNIALSDFGDWFVVVIKQGDNIEMIKGSGITTAADGTATITVASNGRGLNPTYPYAGSSSGLSFQSGAEVIVTNDPLSMAQFGNINLANTWALVQTFSVAPKSSINASDPDDLVRKSQLDAAVLGTLDNAASVVPGNAGETLAIDTLVYFDAATSTWKKCDADTAGTVEEILLGVTRGAGTTGNAITNGVTIFGEHTASTALFTANTVYYASNTAGLFSSTPGTNTVTLGIARTTTKIYFAPRYNQQLTEDQQAALAGTVGTPSGSNKYVTNDDTTGSGSIVRSSLLPVVKFGGTGADGALAIASGTTTIDLAGAQVFVKNYTSISITGTGALAFSNPHANGSIIILKSQGNVTVTSSTVPAIDLRNLGAAGGAAGIDTASAGNSGTSFSYNPGGGEGGSRSSLGTDGTGGNSVNSVYSAYRKMPLLIAGGGGGGGAANGGTGGAGGRGAGGLYIECAGALNITSTINASGTVGANAGAGTSGFNYVQDGAGGGGSYTNGGNGVHSAASQGASGGGGGGGGSIVILYTTLTANTGTYTVTGGAAGTSVSAATSGAGGDGYSLVALNSELL